MSTSPAKVSAFALLRFDGDAAAHADGVSVKAIYDTLEVAEQEKGRLQQLSPGSVYLVRATRRIPSNSVDVLPPPPISEPPALPIPDSQSVRAAIDALKTAHNIVRPSSGRSVLMALASEVAQQLVAFKLGAKQATRIEPWDLWANGRRIEVKVFSVEPMRRAPALHLRSMEFDELAVVGFDAAYTPVQMFLIPHSVVDERATKGSMRDHSLRLTPDLIQRFSRPLM